MPCSAKNAKGQPCKRRCAGPYCPTHAQQGEGFAGDLFKAAGKAALNLAKKAVAPITRRIKAVREGPASKPTSRFEKFLEQTSGQKVVKMELGRKPLLKPVRGAMDVLSAGKFSKKAKELNYDDVFHQYMIYTLEDGSKWKVEKNAVVEHKPATKEDYQNEVFDIPLKGKDLTLKQMIDTASTGNETGFWKYRAGSNNCQRHTRDMIEKNGLLPDDIQPHLAVQDAKALADSLPAATHAIPNFVTDIAAVSDRLIHGDGLPINQRKAIRAMLFGH